MLTRRIFCTNFSKFCRVWTEPSQGGRGAPLCLTAASILTRENNKPWQRNFKRVPLQKCVLLVCTSPKLRFPGTSKTTLKKIWANCRSTLKQVYFSSKPNRHDQHSINRGAYWLVPLILYKTVPNITVRVDMHTINRGLPLPSLTFPGGAPTCRECAPFPFPTLDMQHPHGFF